MACSKLSGRTRGRAKGGTLTLPPYCWLPSMVYLSRTCLVPPMWITIHMGGTRQVRDRYTMDTPSNHVVTWPEAGFRSGLHGVVPGSGRAHARQAGLCCWKCLPANSLCQRLSPNPLRRRLIPLPDTGLPKGYRKRPLTCSSVPTAEAYWGLCWPTASPARSVPRRFSFGPP
jgi:hypothetical protein